MKRAVQPGKSSGLALVAVLWLVAALSLIVTGIVQAVRAEAHTGAWQKSVLVVGAQGDAAILLALQRLQTRSTGLNKSIESMSVNYDGTSYTVSIQSLNGLVDINHASKALLTGLFHHGGGLDARQAEGMADAVMQLRSSTGSATVAQGFEATEDLMRVPGMTYALYAKISHLVTAAIKTGSGRVNPWCAPVRVLEILTDGDTARAQAIAAGRDSDPDRVDTSFLKPELVEMTASNSLRVQTIIPQSGTSAIERAWELAWMQDSRSGLPWRVLSTHTAQVQL